MKIPEGFTPRGDSNEQPLETYDKRVFVIHADSRATAWDCTTDRSANALAWKIPDGPLRIVAYKVLQPETTGAGR